MFICFLTAHFTARCAEACPWHRCPMPPEVPTIRKHEPLLNSELVILVTLSPGFLGTWTAVST